MRELQCGVLVVGGGAAGTRAAYEAKRAHPELEVCLAVTGRYETCLLYTSRTGGKRMRVSSITCRRGCNTTQGTGDDKNSPDYAE